MQAILSVLSTLADLGLVVLGFTAIIFVHELGHFVAARWAGIRVHAFAIGFGPAVLSWRKGLGLRRGSSDGEYAALAASGERRAGGVVVHEGREISPTEYRLNWVLFGGYVKMLGQEDGNPEAVSAEKDGYQACIPWKRMVVISAGVVMNVLAAAALFIVVFFAGLKTMPPKVGDVSAYTPAGKAVAENAGELGLSGEAARLRSGDTVVSIDGKKPNSFNDLVLASSMARRGRAVELEVERAGVEGRLRFKVVPEVGRLSGLLELGIEPARSGEIVNIEAEPARAAFAAQLTKLGFAGVEPGMRVIAAGGEPASTSADVARAFRRSEGRAVEVAFVGPDGREVRVSAMPRPLFEEDLVPAPSGAKQVVEHLLGLVPVMKVVGEENKGGLLKGDIFARIGAVEYPGLAAGMAEIQGHAGRTIRVAVLRDGERVELECKVDRQGRIGFGAGNTIDDSTLLARPPAELTDLSEGTKPRTPAAARLGIVPGSTITAVGGRNVATFADVRAVLREALGPAALAGTGADVAMTFSLPAPAGGERSVVWSMTSDEVRGLMALGWRSPLGEGAFAFEETVLKAGSAWEALTLGVSETHRVMMMTYATFARLFEGTVRVEHLKGPVGIAHVGTLIADRGLVWLLFFLALISVNLAVVNFLPLPIVDGGQFLFILYEQITGRPPSIGFQNVAALAGLALIGTMFIVVTFNDVKNLLGF